MTYARLRATSMVAAIAIALASCTDAPTTAPSNSAPLAQRGGNAAGRAALLTNVPVSGMLSDGGSFAGTFTAQKFAIDQATRQLSLTGVLTGVATLADGSTQTVTQTFTTPVDLSSAKNPGNALHPVSSNCGNAAPASMFHQASYQGNATLVRRAVCDILFLDLGPLHLDLLGLTLDLNEVVLDLNAVSGAGNLLGNLLCAVTGLLDGFALLAAITQLLDTINNILAGLGGLTGGVQYHVAPAAAAAAASYTIFT